MAVEADKPASAYPTSERFPREVVPGLFWLGGCSNSGAWPGREPEQGSHEPCSAWLVVGSERTLLVDTGHFAHWPAVRQQLLKALGARRLDFVFPTHQEIPHSGNLDRLLELYPQALAVGDVRDYHLFFPRLDDDRLVSMAPEDELDLGGTTFVFVEAIWRDQLGTMWGYDTTRRALFSADGLGHRHLHGSGACGLLADELPPESSVLDEALFAHAFHWMRWRDLRPSIAAYRALTGRLPVEVICSGHSAPIVGQVAEFTEAFLASMEAKGTPTGC